MKKRVQILEVIQTTHYLVQTHKTRLSFLEKLDSHVSNDTLNLFSSGFYASVSNDQ